MARKIPVPLNCHLAWPNYKRSDEAKSILGKYDRFTGSAFYSAVITFAVLSYFIGFAEGSIEASLFVVVTSLVIAFGAALYARRRYTLKPLQYAVDNYWPTHDGDLKTDVEAFASLPETISDRFFRAF